MPKPAPGQSYIRPEVRSLPSFGPFRVNPDLHRLQWNENPYDFPADLKEEVLQRLAKAAWSRYPLGFRALDVIDAVAKARGVASDQVVVGNGSSDVLRVVISAVLAPGDTLIIPAPTFGSYRSQAHSIGAYVHEIPLDPATGFALPVDEFIAQANARRAKLIIVCAPNNPTGTVYPPEQLRAIATQTDALLLVDGAYTEFSGQDFRPLLDENDNIVIVQTLSKAYALAGVRVGYALAAPGVAAELQKLINTFTLSPFSEAAAVVALQHLDRFQPSIAAIVAQRERMAAALAALPGITVYPSGANFVLIHLGRPGKDAHAYLRQTHRLLITDMGMYPGYADYLRISVGTPAENDLVIQGLTEFLTLAPT